MNNENNTDDKNKAVSRRAFLRRAGTDALATGAAFVPGLAAANAALKAKGEGGGAAEAAVQQATPGKALGDPNVVREEVSYPSGTAQIKATLLRPKNLSAGTAPGVIVIHEIFGLNDHIRDVAARLALAGYVALAPDLYSRDGGAPEGTDFSTIRAFVSKIADDRMVGDLQAGASYLMTHPLVAGRKVGTVGFCMGGLYVLLFASQTPALGAGVVYYGRPVYRETTPTKNVSPLTLIPRLTVPLQAHYGEADTGIPLADVEALRAAVAKTSVPNEIYTYKDAPHAFHNDTRAEAYREEPAKLAWGRTLAFFDKHLKG